MPTNEIKFENIKNNKSQEIIVKYEESIEIPKCNDLDPINI